VGQKEEKSQVGPNVTANPMGFCTTPYVFQTNAYHPQEFACDGVKYGDYQLRVVGCERDGAKDVQRVLRVD
jgi:hypothetical protein